LRAEYANDEEQIRRLIERWAERTMDSLLCFALSGSGYEPGGVTDETNLEPDG
jgi:hypothetical protein